MGKKFTMLWRNKYLTADAKTIEDFAKIFEETADDFKKMAVAGVTLDPDSGIEDDYAEFTSHDPKVAKKFGFDAIECDDECEDGGCIPV